MNRPGAWTLAVLALGAGSIFAQANEPARKLIAVLEFHTKLSAAEQADADPGYFSDVVRAQTLDALPGARLMTHENMIVLLQAAGKDLSQCEGECDVETGRKLGADYVVSGELLKVGTSFKLDLKIHATGSGELLEGAQASGKTVDALDEAVQAAVKKLVTPLLGALGPKNAGAPQLAQPVPVVEPQVPAVGAPQPLKPGQARPARTQAAQPARTEPAQGAQPQTPQQTQMRQPSQPGGNKPSPGRVKTLAEAQAETARQPPNAPPAVPSGGPAGGYRHIRVYPDHIGHMENFFALERATLRPEAAPMMRELAQALSQPASRPANAVCVGETLTMGAFRLARQRALAIRHALIELHVPPERIGWKALRHGDKTSAQMGVKVCSIVLR